MELGKRKSKVELYVESLMESPEKKQRKTEFESNLKQFYKRKWNAPVKAPYVHGIEFDLYKLYDVVMAFGGWQKVSQMEKWPDVAEQFGIKEDILGGDNAIKILYMRYLSKFEQNETVGDMDDMMDSEVLRSRNRQSSFLATSECPVYIPRFPHSEMQRMASNEADYGRLTKSLISGLPNEVDFAMNVCTLLSHPGPRLLKVANAPNIISLLLAHIGIFDSDDEWMSTLYSTWKEKSGRDYMSFWACADINEEYLKIFVPQALNSKCISLVGKDLFVGLTPSFSSNDPISWRVYQVATVLRNLSFEPINKAPLAESWDILKFCVLASNSSWSQLATAALDTLSNIASDINLSNIRMLYDGGHSILRTINTGIFSNDKFKLIRCMELLAGLSGADENESVLCQFLNRNLLSKMFSYLLVKDIMLCVYTLECIYQISEMGGTSCDLICEVDHGLSILLSLASIEAVSFGPSGLAGMKVVEYHGPGTIGTVGTNQGGGGGSQSNTHQVHQGIIPSHIIHHPPPQGIPMISSQHMNTSTTQSNQSHPIQQIVNTVPSHPIISTARVIPPSQSTTSTTSSTHTSPAKAGETKIEELTSQWIRRCCIADGESTTSRGDLYAAYVDDMRNMHHSLSSSLQTFTNMIKMIYPQVSFRLPEGCTIMLAYGLKLNKPHKLASSTTTPNISQGGNSSLNKMNNGNRNSVGPSSNHNEASTSSPSNTLSDKSNDSHPVMKSILEDKVNEKNDKDDAAQDDGIVSSEVEAPEVISESNVVETKIERIENKGIVENNKKEEEESKENDGECIDDKKEDKEEEVKGKMREDEKKEKINEEEGKKDKEKDIVKNIIESSNPPPPPPSSSSSSSIHGKGDLMCEWDGCAMLFDSSSSLLHHATRTHLTFNGMSPCKWTNCDGTQRSKWSLVTHLQDHHASDHHLKEACKRRKDGRSSMIPPRYSSDIPRDMPQHPGYSKTAAIDAIRRHAFNFIIKDLTEDVEGPVTKSIRLTSCLILRNIARYSVEGRLSLRRNERLLSWMALSRMESNGALAQLLSELPKQDDNERVEGDSNSNSSAPPSVPSIPSLSS